MSAEQAHRASVWQTRPQLAIMTALKACSLQHMHSTDLFLYYRLITYFFSEIVPIIDSFPSLELTPRTFYWHRYTVSSIVYRYLFLIIFHYFLWFLFQCAILFVYYTICCNIFLWIIGWKVNKIWWWWCDDTKLNRLTVGFWTRVKPLSHRIIS